MNLKTEIEKILEKTCGFECPNGGGSERLAVDQLFYLFEKTMTEIIGKDEDIS